MIWLLTFLFLLYLIAIVSFAFGFLKIKEFKFVKAVSKTTFSVLIPFRNEAENLPLIVNSIINLKYPNKLVEFIFVDDDSSDDSVQVIRNTLDTISLKSKITQVDIRIIKNKRASNSPKKDAITTAISLAKHDWILTTDADCLLPEKWLQTFNNFILKESPKMVVAPVNYKVDNSFFQRFQLLDFLSLQGITIGSFGIGFAFLCNGANLAYKKADFINLNGFTNNNQIASGDDIFLLEKFIKLYKKKVRFLKSKDVIVKTFPVKNWKDLVNQRVRWAAKTSNYSLLFAKLIGVLVLVINLILVGLFFSLHFKLFFLLFAMKLIIDLFIFIPTIKFYNQKVGFLKHYLQCAFIYPFFSVFVVFKSAVSNYTWKDRSFKK
jgi:cellulose synthase/poly-beta-1,6-N-acetylglucosamine synthase-like glycosyltransferase